MRTVNMSLVVFLLLSLGTTHAQDKKDKPEVLVKLLDAGSEPRQVLRYRAVAGAKESMLVSMKMEMAMEIGGNKLPVQPAPTMEMIMDIDVLDSDDDQIRYKFVLSEARVLAEDSVPEETLQAMETQLQLMVGMEGESLITRRGFTVEGSFSPPENAPEMARQMLKGIEKSIGEMSSPLPEEPVGLGAKWQIEQEFDANGMRMKQTIIHELKKLGPHDVTTNISLVQSAEPQQLQLPGLPENVKIHLDSLNSVGQGQLNLDLTKLVPQSNIDLVSTAKMTTVAAEQRQETQVTTKMEMKITPNQ